MLFFDTETCGLHGPIVLLQYAEDDGPIILHEVWRTPIHETLELIEHMCSHEGGVIGFNLTFDWFHICQLYTLLSLFPNKTKEPVDCIREIAALESKARDGVCLKPVKAFDIMLHARKGPYQNTMNRDDIRVRKVPTALAWQLADELDKRVKIKDIYFARKADKKKRWQVMDITNDLGDTVPDFKDIVLKFAPTTALKALAIDTGVACEDTRLLFSDISLPEVLMPKEIGYAPFNQAVGAGSWPDVIKFHIDHWAFHQLAREYASDDVKDTRGLYHFFGSPSTDDDDSVLACMVGAVRWRGFKVDLEKLEEQRKLAQGKIDGLEFNFQSVEVCKKYLYEAMSETERLVVRRSTKSVILEEIAKWKESTVCPKCEGLGCKECNDSGMVTMKELVTCNRCKGKGCKDCDNKGNVLEDKKHPAAKRAQVILDARHAKKEMELYEKLILAGRFHASFNVIGALSSRMSGADGLNPQGIKHSKSVRRCFPLAWDDLMLCGGDFDSFEVGLMDAAYGDPELRKDLQTYRPCTKCKGVINPKCGECEGTGKELTKIHGLFGTFLFPPMTYDEIMSTKGLADSRDKYRIAKSGVFLMAYGGTQDTMVSRLGIVKEVADKAYQGWCDRYQVWGQERKKIFDKFCSMRQPKGIGSKVEWHEPSDYIESMMGFKRYFTLENQICKALFDLAENPPKAWTELKIKVVRRDREQTASGAVRSALFAAAFNLQAGNMRAAANHVIQSAGAQITKALQRRLWDLQPSGINNWRVQPLNIHDEIMCPMVPEVAPAAKVLVDSFIEEMKPKVPLIGMKWGVGMKSWAEK